MIRKLLAVVALGVVAAAGLVTSAPHRSTAALSATPKVLDVLFVGNSLLGTRARTGEDTPDVVRRLARSSGRTLRTYKAIRYGNTLQKTWDSGLSRTALTGQLKYDFIVLQEYSTLVATNFAKAEATLLGTYAPVLSQALKPGGKVVLFKNWALTDCKPFASRTENVAAIESGYARLLAAMPVPTVIAPISETFERVVSRHGVSRLIVPDGKHPTGAAIYLDAAVLYGLMFERSPRDLPNLFVPGAVATSLRDAAATTLGR